MDRGEVNNVQAHKDLLACLRMSFIMIVPHITLILLNALHLRHLLGCLSITVFFLSV